MGPGQIVTFFSFKGGVGRSMALANVGVLLARWGFKVLMVDWDLEAPGLENFFSEYVDLGSIEESEGVLDILTWNSEKASEVAERSWWEDSPVEIPLSDLRGSLFLLTAGRRDSKYYSKVRSLDVQALYAQRGGGHYLEEIRNRWKQTYDFVLIDSRTGITDLGGICTVQMPDTLVVLFTATEQAVRGVLEIAGKATLARQKLPFERLTLTVVPVPSRLDVLQEHELSQRWLDRFASEMAPLYGNWLPRSLEIRRILEMTKLIYVPYFSFGERLAVLDQGTKDPTSLGYGYENLTALIAHRLEKAEQVVNDRDDFIRDAAKPRRLVEKAHMAILYCEEDEHRATVLERELTLLKDRRIDLWSAERLSLDKSGYEELRESIRLSHVVAPLISPPFIRSVFATFSDFARFVDEEAKRGLSIVPVIVRSCPWRSIPWLGKRHPLPQSGEPWVSGGDEEIGNKTTAIVGELHDLLEASAISVMPYSERKSRLYDVFLSHGSRDKATVRRLAEILGHRGLRVWFDEWELIPGRPWQEAVEEMLDTVGAAAVLVGESGLGPWQEREMRAVLAEAVQRGLPVIPVLLPEASEKPTLPLFLEGFTWVDLREGLTDAGLDRLIWGITGSRPHRA